MPIQQTAWTGPRLRLSRHDPAGGGAERLDIACGRTWPAGAIVAVFFVVFAAVEWIAVRDLGGTPVRDVMDLAMLLFRIFWAVGWSVGVLALGALTLILLLAGESAWLEPGCLVRAWHVGPFKGSVSYDLGRVRQLRLEPAATERVQLRFRYDAATVSLGAAMPRAEGEALLARIAVAAPDATTALPVEHATPAVAPPVVRQAPRHDTPAPPAGEQAAERFPSASVVALVVANLMPLAGVLFFHWDLAGLLVLFWSESAIIGFYTALKIAVTGRIAALAAVPFFAAHFGGFMAIHFLFIYTLFVRGTNAAGPAPGVRDALTGVFAPLWTPLAMLAVSHGVSFVTNFLGEREYERTSVRALMSAPYERIVLMHITIIFGGWVVLLAGQPVGALVLLVLLKTVLDLRAHRREHRRAAR